MEKHTQPPPMCSCSANQYHGIASFQAPPSFPSLAVQKSCAGPGNEANHGTCTVIIIRSTEIPQVCNNIDIHYGAQANNAHCLIVYLKFT